MKAKLFSIFTAFILFSSVYLPLSVAQDYTTWNLPEGAKARLGKGTIEDIQFSPDNKLLAVAGSIGVWIYDVDTDEELALLTGHTGTVTSIAFSPDGETLASGSWDYTIRLWNVSSFTLNRTLAGHTSGVTSVAFSSDGKTLASGSVDKTVRLWNVFTGTEEKIFIGHTDRVTSIAFGPDDALLASGSWDKTVRLWNVFRGEHQQTFTGHTDRVTSVSFSQNPIIPILASGSHDRTIRLWDMETGELKQTLTDATDIPMGPVDSVCFRSDGYMLISGSVEGWARIWATLNGALKQEVSVGFGVGFGGPNVCFSPDGGMFASADSERNIRLWYMTPKINYEVSIMPDPKIDGPYDPVRLVLSQDGKTAAAFMPNGFDDPESFVWKIRISDVSTGQLKAILNSEDWGFVYDISLSSDGKTLTSVGRELNPDYLDPEGFFVHKYQAKTTLRLWDTSTGRLKYTVVLHDSTHPQRMVNIGQPSSVSFSPDGSTLAVAATATQYVDGRGWVYTPVLDLFNAFTGQLRYDFTGFTAGVTKTYFSPDSETLVSGHEDGTIRLWDVATGFQKQMLIGHTEPIYGVTFSPDSKAMASVSGFPGSTFRLWNFAPGERQYTLVKRSSSYVRDICFSRDGKAAIEYNSRRWWEGTSEFIWYRSADLYYWRSIIPNTILPDDWEPWREKDFYSLWDVSTGEKIQSEGGFFAVGGQFALDGEGLTLLTIRLGQRIRDGVAVPGEDEYRLVSLDLSGITAKGVNDPEREYKQQTITGHSGPVRSVSFGPDGETLAVGSEEAIRLWDVDTAAPTLKDTYPFIVDPENKFTFSEIYVIVYDYGIFNRFTQTRP